jgi:TonB-linked SusC/RagA family outer membrane protein
MKQLLLALGTILIISVPLMAAPRYFNETDKNFFQSNPITGKVTNDKGEPLAGVTVQVKGLTTSTTTGADGSFTIDAPAGAATLVFTHVGMERKEISIAGKKDFQIQLSASNASLDEVVVIGYGSQKARDVTGSVVPVNLKKLEDMPTATITEALRGQVPGLSVQGGNARPGVNATLSIRQQFGWGKDGSSTLPLIVIDDVIQLDPSTGLPTMDQFNLLDLSEVETITVLRDASAAIYGSRASQGAIVVKTKKGKIGSPKISYSGKFEYNDAISHVKTMNAYDYGIFANRYGRAAGWNASSFFDAAELEQMKSTNWDWRDEAWKGAGAMQHSLNVSGGSERATYFAGASYFTQDANMGSQDYNRWTFRSGTDVKVVNNLKLSATVSANNFSVEKSFTKVSIQDGGYGVNSEQNDYLALAHMPRYIPWQYSVDGVNQYVSPALGPNRVQTNPAGQNNISGWNYFALLNNGSKTTSGNFSYNTNFSLQYDIPFVKGLSVRGSYGLSYATDNTEQVQLPQLLAAATNTNATGTHLYDPTTTTWNVKENTRGTRVSYSDAIGKIQQANFFINYDNSFGLHNISALASVEKGQQDYQKKFVIYDNPLSGGYNGASTSAGTLNTSNTYVQRTEGGNLSYLGRVSYNYDSKYLLQFLFRADASTKFAPENYWGFFPSLSAGWVISEEPWFNNNVSWVDNLKLRASVGKTGNDNLKPWRWLQLYSYAADKGFGFGQNGGLLVAGLNPDPTPNRNVTWDKTIKQNYGIDASFLRNRLSVSVDHYRDHITDMLTQMAGMVGVPISVGGAFAEQNFASVNTWGTEVSANWRDRIGKEFEYSIGMNYGTGDNKVTKYIPVAFDYPSKNQRQEGYSTIFPAWGFMTWKETSTGDGLLRTDADIDAYWAYLTELATKAGTTPSYLGITSKSGIRKGMLAYEDRAGQLDAGNRTIAGQNGKIEEDEDFARLKKKNRSQGINTSLGFSWKNLSLSAQIAISWGGYNSIDYIKQGTSSGQIFWSHESYLTDMYDTLDNVNGKWPNLAYHDENSPPSDFWQISSFRSYVRSMSLGYTLPKGIARKVRMENLRLSLSGFNLWDFYNPYPDKYRNMYDDPTTGYPILRTWALGVNATF